MKLLTQKEIIQRFRLTRTTLLSYEAKGLIHPVYTPGGHRRYKETDILNLLGLSATNTSESEVIRAVVYSRVSNKKQQTDGNLKRQTQRLIEYVKSKNYKLVKVYEEIGSGVNENRKQLNKLLNDALKNGFDVVVIEYKDRLARFGYNYISKLLSSFGVNIEIVNESNTDEIDDLVEDLIAIFTSFSARIYGRRGGKSRQ